jgi:ferritin-like metal-binding protein YciE
MKIDSLKRLYVHQLKDLYNAENQLLKALPQMAQKAAHAELRAAFEQHTEETRDQIAHLEKIFDGLEFAPGGEHCPAMEGLIEEGKEAMQEPEDDNVRDAAMIAAAQRVEHYEMAGYGTVRTYAEILGRTDDVQILEQILEQEKATDEKLNRIALDVVNPAAANA